MPIVCRPALEAHGRHRSGVCDRRCVGTARAAGGVCVTIGDLARLGQLVLDGGVAQAGQRVIPADWIADMHQNGNRDAWNAGNFAHMFPDGRYRSCWYEVGDGRGSFAAVGIHEQWLWVDPHRAGQIFVPAGTHRRYRDGAGNPYARPDRKSPVIIAGADAGTRNPGEMWRQLPGCENEIASSRADQYLGSQPALP
jgi:CubicO group peptidase (beta-lactamase class C family)